MGMSDLVIECMMFLAASSGLVSIILWTLGGILVIGVVLRLVTRVAPSPAKWAKSRGYDFQASNDALLLANTEGLYLRIRGEALEFGNIVSGDLGNELRFWLGTYRYRDSTKTSAILTPIFVELPSAVDGVVLVRPKGLGDRFTNLFDVNSINFESSEFNRSFMVNASSERFAYDLLQPQFLEALLHLKRVDLEIHEHLACILISNSAIQVADYDRLIATAEFLTSLIPEFLFDNKREPAIG